MPLLGIHLTSRSCLVCGKQLRAPEKVLRKDGFVLDSTSNYETLSKPVLLFEPQFPNL